MSKILSRFRRSNIDNFIGQQNYEIVGVEIADAGDDYANGGVVSFDSGVSGQRAVFDIEVTANGGIGPVTSISIANPGDYDNAPDTANVVAVSAGGEGLYLNLTARRKDSLYTFIGRQTEHASTTTPDVEVENEHDGFYSVWQQMMFGREADLHKMIRRITWEANTVYAAYDDQSATATTDDFYVINSQRDVFKCLDNNSGAESTEEPTQTTTLPEYYSSADGYVWFYLYTLDEETDFEYGTANWMPVFENEAASPVDGAIHTILVENSGEQYPSHSGSLTVAGNNYFLDIGADLNLSYYAGCDITAIAGSDIVIRRIVDSFSNTDMGMVQVSLANNLPAEFSNTDVTYTIGPAIELESSTGTGCAARCLMNEDNGSIVRVEVISQGEGYRSARVTASAGPSYGSGAELRAVISPIGGHGSNLTDELYCQHVCIKTAFDVIVDDANTFPIDVTYHTVGLLKNPLKYDEAESGLVRFDGFDFNQMTRLTVDPGANFNIGSVVRGNIGGSVGWVAISNNTTIALTGVEAADEEYEEPFVSGEVLVDENGVSRTIISLDTVQDLQPYTGEIMYLQNVNEIVRTADTNEQVKLIVKF